MQRGGALHANTRAARPFSLIINLHFSRRANQKTQRVVYLFMILMVFLLFRIYIAYRFENIPPRGNRLGLLSRRGRECILGDLNNFIIIFEQFLLRSARELKPHEGGREGWEIQIREKRSGSSKIRPEMCNWKWKFKTKPLDYSFNPEKLFSVFYLQVMNMLNYWNVLLRSATATGCGGEKIFSAFFTPQKSWKISRPGGWCKRRSRKKGEIIKFATVGSSLRRLLCWTISPSELGCRESF